MLSDDTTKTLTVFGILTSFVFILFLLLKIMYSSRLTKFKAMHPSQDLKSIEKALAQTNVRLAITGDLSELVVWFISQPRNRNELRSMLNVLLESSCEGFMPEESYTRARYLEWDEKTGELTPFTEYISSGVPSFSGSHFPVGIGAPGQSFSSGEVVIVDNFSEAHPDIRDAWTRPYKSVVCVPVPTIPDPRQRIGVLNFDAPVTNYFTEEHVLFLRSVSNYVFIICNHVLRRDVPPVSSPKD